MPAKDLYKILDLPQTAGQEEIKKAYRQLALKYHPDVNAGGKATENWFREIHEAYKVLGDPNQRSRYDQERWYRESTTTGKTEAPSTPEQMLAKSARLVKYVSNLDRDRTNLIALQRYLLHLLSDENLQMLGQWNNQMINLQIADELIAASDALGYKSFLPVAEKIQQLVPESEVRVQQVIRQKQRTSYWRSYQFPIILLAAILLCLLIYFTGR